ncbi:MAG TPA: energy transducer TonB, partial [Burkholderiaceae bacterium]
MTLPLITPDVSPAPAPAPLVTQVPAPPPQAAPAAPVETPPAPAPSLSRTIPPSGIQYIVPPAPVYSRISARMRESGKAVVRVFIGEDGLPRTVQLATSTGFARLD